MFLEPPEIELVDLVGPRHAFVPNKMPEPSVQGLPSLINQRSREEIDKLVADLISGCAHNTMNTSSVAERKIQITAILDSPPKVLPSPTKYKTRSVCHAEMATSPAGVEATIGTPKTAKFGRKSASPGQRELDNTPTRLTRSATAKILHAQDKLTSVPKTTTPTVLCSATLDSMNRKLQFDSSASDKLRQRLDSAPDPPPFDLGFETQTNPRIVMCDGTTRSLTSSDVDEQLNNEDKDDKTEEVDMEPTHASPMRGIPDSNNENYNSNAPGASITPIDNEYQKRVIKNAKFQRPPYIDYKARRNFHVSKPVSELYNLVCNHGVKTNSETNSETNYLIECRFSLRGLKKCFARTETNKLDHKHLICFPTLQSIGGINVKHSGHYFLVNLNIKARRFEILHSITTLNGESIMMDSCHLLIASIKRMWSKGHKASSLDITDFPIEVIPSPEQTNGYDCGFFMLKNLEEWDSRSAPSYDQNDLPNIRKLYNDKWIRFHENKATWQLII